MFGLLIEIIWGLFSLSLSLPDSHEDHAGSHVQTSNRTGDAYVHINNGQGPSAVIGYLTGQTKLTSDRGGRGSLLLVNSFLSSSFFFLWADDFSSSSFLPCLCLTCNGHFVDMRCFFPSDQLKRQCVCVCVYCYLFVLPVLFCVTSVRLCGRTYRVNASQFIFLYSCNAIWYFYYTSCIVSFSSLFIYFSCKYIFC